MKLKLSRIAIGLGIGALATTASSCDIDVFVPFPEAGGPAGVIRGSLTYVGPPPCTEGGFIVGAAIFLGFEENLLPPPEGLGTLPIALNAITGEVLFSSIRHELTFEPNGDRWCPPAGAAPVVVSGDYTLGPLQAGVYEVRGFYDLDGNFNPGFSIFNLPSSGDIGGGAILNATEALQGAPVQYRRVQIGNEQPDGSLIMPPEGYLVDGVAVSFGLALPLDRPTFHATAVLDDLYGNTQPSDIVIPSDYQLGIFPTDQAFVQIRLAAGLTTAETTAAAEKPTPFDFPSDPFLLLNRQDVNLDGVIDDVNDGIPESSGGTFVPALLPLAILTKLEEGNDLEAQSGPTVLLQGITVNDGLIPTIGLPPEFAEPRAEIQVALRPAVLCVDTTVKGKPGVLLNTHETDSVGTVLVADVPALEAALSAQFLRPISVVQNGCLPEGRYAMNLVYSTGQAWTVPNEAGICLPGEPASSDGAKCGVRPRLESQSVVVTIGPPDDPQHCIDNPMPPECVHAPATE